MAGLPVLPTLTRLHPAFAQTPTLAQAVTNWINSMAEVHRDRMPQTVHYTTAMPDLESLMQEWPPQVEAALSKVQLPSADLDVSLAQYTDIVCGAYRCGSRHTLVDGRTRAI